MPNTGLAASPQPCHHLGVTSLAPNSSPPDSPQGTVKRKQLLHSRAYEVEAFLEDQEHFRLIGELRDVAPDGLWGIDDNEPMTIHHMHVELVIKAATLTITEASVEMRVRPQTECTNILPAYDGLVGLSIVRGFTHKIREMFGGPKACTHIAALVNAMAPVAMQTMWSFGRATGARRDGIDEKARFNPDHFQMNRDTCHVWASEGPMFSLLAQAQPVPVALWAKKRLEEKGIDEDEWRKNSW
jgi:hypothetical protein